MRRSSSEKVLLKKCCGWWLSIVGTLESSTIPFRNASSPIATSCCSCAFKYWAVQLAAGSELLPLEAQLSLKHTSALGLTPRKGKLCLSASAIVGISTALSASTTCSWKNPPPESLRPSKELTSVANQMWSQGTRMKEAPVANFVHGAISSGLRTAFQHFRAKLLSA
eukprot:4467296-Amphidinium_carterae.1